MIKKKHIALILILSLFSVDNVYGEGACTKEDEKEFKKVARDYKITYKFNLETKDYIVTVYDPQYKKYMYVIDDSEFYNGEKEIKENEIIYSGIKAGNYSIRVTESGDGCKSTLKEFELELPKYNIYYEDPLCDGIEEFVLCQPTYKREIDRETFEYRINDYKNKKNKQEESEKQKNEYSKNKIVNYIKENFIQVTIIVIFIILIIITTIITIKTSRKSRRLE